MKLIFCLCLQLILVLPLSAQFPKIDSAKAAVITAKSDKEKLEKLLALSKHRNSMNSDTIIFYAKWAYSLAHKLNDTKGLAYSAYNIITSDLVKGNTDSVIPKIEQNKLFIDVKNLDIALYFKIQLLKANILNRKNKRTEALELELQLLAEAEKDKHILSQLFLLHYIGATYLNINNSEKAIQVWKNAYTIINEKKNTEFDEIETYILNDFAKYYLNKYVIKPDVIIKDSVSFFIEKCISLCRRIESMGVLATALSYRALFFNSQKKINDAENDFKEALSIRKKIDDPLYIVEDYKYLASFYLSNKQYDKCYAALTEGMEMCSRNKINEANIDLNTILALAYKTQNDNANYAKTLERIIVLTDSNYRINSLEKIADIQTKYEVQKKETLIAQQKLELFQRNLLLYGAGAAIFILLTFLGFRFNKYKKKQKIKNEAKVKEAEEKERKRIAAELHDNLGVQANAILHNSTLLKNGKNNLAVVEDLQETAKEMLHNLRETLWAMKTADVIATDLWLRIINFMRQMGRHYTAISFIVEGDAPRDFKIGSNKALNIVLVVQETVNNAVKHSEGTTITASCQLNGMSWTIVIKDNGKGFDTTLVNDKKDNYGLANMKERAVATHFEFILETELNKGTTVTITI